LDEVAELFYQTLLSAPGSAAVLKSEAQVMRLKKTLAAWMNAVLTGPHDDNYRQTQVRIGQVHVVVGVPPRYVFTAMCVMRDALTECVRSEGGPEQALEFASALQRITEVNLAVIMDTYIEGREERELATLQELLISNLPATILLIDAEGSVTSATALDTRLFDPESAVRHHFLEVLPEDLTREARLEERVERAISTGREVTVLRIDAEVGDRTRTYRVSVLPLEHPRARALIHVADLTDTIRTEARLRRAENLAQLGAFSAAVAHELRNPLAGISGAIQVIVNTMEASDSRKTIMEKVDQQVRRLNDLVSDLLALAKPKEAHLQPVALAEAAQGAIDVVGSEHPEAELRVEGEGTVEADPDLLHQILLNLLQNALQAHEPEAALRVEVRIGTNTLKVFDAGSGIPAEAAARIFEPFFTTRTRGTGLGLAICRQAAEAMGAELRTTESPLGGAGFVLEWSD